MHPFWAIENFTFYRTGSAFLTVPALLFLLVINYHLPILVKTQWQNGLQCSLSKQIKKIKKHNKKQEYILDLELWTFQVVKKMHSYFIVVCDTSFWRYTSWFIRSTLCYNTITLNLEVCACKLLVCVSVMHQSDM